MFSHSYYPISMCSMQDSRKYAKIDGNPPVSIKEASEIQKVKRKKKQHNINKHLKIPPSFRGGLA